MKPARIGRIPNETGMLPPRAVFLGGKVGADFGYRRVFWALVGRRLQAARQGWLLTGPPRARGLSIDRGEPRGGRGFR